MGFIPPKVKTQELQFVLNDVYKHLNELYESNKGSSDIESLGSGEPGDIRIVKKSNREAGIELRILEGWFSSLIYSQTPNVTKLTDSSGGASTNNIIEEVTDVATAKNGIKELATKLNEVIDIVNSVNNSGFEMTTKGRR